MLHVYKPIMLYNYKQIMSYKYKLIMLCDCKIFCYLIEITPNNGHFCCHHLTGFADQWT